MWECVYFTLILPIFDKFALEIGGLCSFYQIKANYMHILGFFGLCGVWNKGD
jgi:hypothetical protein